MLRSQSATYAPLVLAAALTASVKAQIIYTENFETNWRIGQLQGAGWIFRNQSQPPNELGWDVANSGGPVGFMWLEGSTWAGGGAISTWAIMPQISGQAAGMPMRFHAYGAHTGTARYDRMELRYSPSGGTSTGADADDHGDFTEVLWSATPQELGLWWNGPVEVVLPGGGRLAWRYVRTGPDESGRMGVDGIEIGSPNAAVPFPGPGETVRWTLAMSPIVIDSDRMIVEEGTVVVEPGVVVQIAANKRLTVQGTLTGEGSQAQTIVLQGGPDGGVEVGGAGRLELGFAEIACRVTENNGSRVTLRDSVVRDGAGGFGLGRTALNIFERCVIEQDFFEPWGTLVMRDVELTGSTIRLMHYNRLDNVTAHAPIQFIAGCQDVFIDNVHVTGVADGAGLDAHPGTWTSADVLLGANNTLGGNRYPVRLGGPGLHPGAAVPATGNTNNAILLDAGGGGLRYNRTTWPDLGVPYHVVGDVMVQGAVDVDPGLRFQAAPESTLRFTATQSDYRIRGTPERPLRFEALDPGQGWYGVGLYGGVNLVEHATIRDAAVAIAGVVGGVQHVGEVLLQGNRIGIRPSNSFLYVSGTRFFGNDIGAEEDSGNIFVGLDLDGGNRPNLFEGNALAVHGIMGSSGAWLRIPAENNWWNAPDGPGGELGGSGDPVTSNTDPFPFLTARPDLSDTPPVVRLVTRPYLYALPGETLILEWDARDDGSVVSQEIVVQTTQNEWITLASGLPGSARSAEVVLPPGLARARIVATDDAGQSSFEQFGLIVPPQAPAGTVGFHTDVSRGFTGGEEISVCYDALGVTRGVQVYLELGGEERWVRGPAGNPGTDKCASSDLRIPYISTDRARLAIDGSGGNNTEWYFSDFFEIRPPAELGDQPPRVAMTSPAHGAVFAGGTTIPIAWTASDDDGLREFKIQYSTNGGHTWHTLRHRLPGDQRSFDWRLPPSAGIDDLRLRVVAADLHFQSSAAGDDSVVSVTPGAGCRADLDGSGTLTLNDFVVFRNLYVLGDLAADFDNSGALTLNDFVQYRNAYVAGCP